MRMVAILAVTLMLSAPALAQTAEHAHSASTCQEIGQDVFDAAQLPAMVQNDVVLRLGDGADLQCSPQRRHGQECHISGRVLIKSNEAPARYFEIASGQTAVVTTTPFTCAAGE